MNQKEAGSVNNPLKDTVKALGVVTERKCPKCKGVGEWMANVAPVGTPPEYSEPFIEYCSNCKGTGKVIPKDPPCHEK